MIITSKNRISVSSSGFQTLTLPGKKRVIHANFGLKMHLLGSRFWAESSLSLRRNPKFCVQFSSPFNVETVQVKNGAHPSWCSSSSTGFSLRHYQNVRCIRTRIALLSSVFKGIAHRGLDRLVRKVALVCLSLLLPPPLPGATTLDNLLLLLTKCNWRRKKKNHACSSRRNQNQNGWLWVLDQRKMRERQKSKEKRWESKIS